jgi:hypothetical protein
VKTLGRKQWLAYVRVCTRVLVACRRDQICAYNRCAYTRWLCWNMVCEAYVINL